MNILIKSWSANSNNLQANKVEEVLLAKGHKVTIDTQGNFPRHQFGSIQLSSNTPPALSFLGKDICKDNNVSFDTVVFFAEKTFLFPEQISEKDKFFIESESKDFLNATNYFLGEDIFWVNPPKSFAKSALKPVQLKVASDLGFTIPNTLISNTPDDIVSFVNDNKQQTIVKPFNNMTWFEEGVTQAYLPTTIITPEQVKKHKDSLSYCPMIYQECIKQKYEIRVTVFGHTVMAVRMRKKENNNNTVDWRLDINAQNMVIEAFELPNDLKEKCIQVNIEFGLVYSTFDIAVDEQGNYIFYEVNNAGRFLWKEELAGLPMTNIFCDFVESRDPHFKWQ